MQMIQIFKISVNFIGILGKIIPRYAGIWRGGGGESCSGAVHTTHAAVTGTEGGFF